MNPWREAQIMMVRRRRRKQVTAVVWLGATLIVTGAIVSDWSWSRLFLAIGIGLIAIAVVTWVIWDN